MKNKKISYSHLIVLAVSLFVSLLLLVTSITLAAYTNSRHAQRTIATYETTGDRFSSNLLAKLTGEDNVKTLYVTDEMTSPNTVVTVCNYEQGKQTQPHEKDITYVLKAEFVVYNGSTGKYEAVDEAYLVANSLTGYSFSLTKGGTTVTLNSTHASDDSFGKTLTNGVADSDAYTLTMSPSFVQNKPNLYVRLTVTPSGTGIFLSPLIGIFKADLRSEGASTAWTGVFSDDTAIAPNQYNGYNYLISGQGSGTYTLRWDGTKVQLSALSLNELLSVEGATQDGNSVVLPVNSDVTSRYEIQFYKVSGNSITTETWSQMNNSVVTFR